MPEFRLDFGRLSRVQRTPTGGLRAPAYLTRTGVFVYRRADGSEVRELRHPDEVFHEDSLATLAGAPVTDLHPSTMVRADNWTQLAKGHVSETIRKDGKFVAGDVFVQDSSTVRAVESEERSEISLGYTCELRKDSGTYEGERYDAVQTNIRYNHAALGPRNWGRAGNDVGLRLDSSDQQNVSVAVQVREDAGDQPTHTKEPEVMKVIKLDGKEYEYGSEAHIEKLDSMHRAELDKERARADQLKAENDKMQAKLDAKEEDLKKAHEATKPEAVQARVDARVRLVSTARELLGDDVKLDDKTDREIMVDCIKADSEGFSAEGKSDDYVTARFDALCEKGIERRDGIGGALRAAQSARADSSDPVKDAVESRLKAQDGGDK